MGAVPSAAALADRRDSGCCLIEIWYPVFTWCLTASTSWIGSWAQASFCDRGWSRIPPPYGRSLSVSLGSPSSKSTESLLGQLADMLKKTLSLRCQFITRVHTEYQHTSAYAISFLLSCYTALLNTRFWLVICGITHIVKWKTSGHLHDHVEKKKIRT